MLEYVERHEQTITSGRKTEQHTITDTLNALDMAMSKPNDDQSIYILEIHNVYMLYRLLSIRYFGILQK